MNADLAARARRGGGRVSVWYGTATRRWWALVGDDRLLDAELVEATDPAALAALVRSALVRAGTRRRPPAPPRPAAGRPPATPREGRYRRPPAAHAALPRRDRGARWAVAAHLIPRALGWAGGAA
ncbi:hypothetical protein [Actinomadura atramentaria]|uniref:hypothetical protein n=1 Tax=Actinomadura atramentaria TaxID=1990 RepID=UPI00035EC170|nr:hypothetical protein [Actinomadura atramentaria]